MSHLTSPVNECNTIPENSMAMTRLQGLGVITSAILPENNPKKLPRKLPIGHWQKKQFDLVLVGTNK